MRRKFRRIWAVAETADSIWSKIGYVLLPVGGVGGAFGLLTDVDVPGWAIWATITIVCFGLTPLPFIVAVARQNRRERRRASDELIGVIKILHERFIAVEGGVAQNSEDIALLNGRILKGFQEQHEFNSDTLKALVDLSIRVKSLEDGVNDEE